MQAHKCGGCNHTNVINEQTDAVELTCSHCGAIMYKKDSTEGSSNVAQVASGQVPPKYYVEYNEPCSSCGKTHSIKAQEDNGTSLLIVVMKCTCGQYVEFLLL